LGHRRSKQAPFWNQHQRQTPAAAGNNYPAPSPIAGPAPVAGNYTKDIE